MPGFGRMPEPSLREQLIDARVKVQRQIDRLRARAYPIAPIGWTSGGKFAMALGLVSGLSWCVAPFGANGTIIDNTELIEKLGRTLRDIDEALEGLGPND